MLNSGILIRGNDNPYTHIISVGYDYNSSYQDTTIGWYKSRIGALSPVYFDDIECDYLYYYHNNKSGVSTNYMQFHIPKNSDLHLKGPINVTRLDTKQKYAFVFDGDSTKSLECEDGQLFRSSDEGKNIPLLIEYA